MNSKNTVKLNNGGTASISAVDGGYRINFTRGYGETPMERVERIKRSNRGGYHSDKRRGNRSAEKRRYLREEW